MIANHDGAVTEPLDGQRVTDEEPQARRVGNIAKSEARSDSRGAGRSGIVPEYGEDRALHSTANIGV
jgi:hypothetical protein